MIERLRSRADCTRRYCYQSVAAGTASAVPLNNSWYHVGCCPCIKGCACPILNRHDPCPCTTMESHLSLAACFCFAERAAFFDSHVLVSQSRQDHPSSCLRRRSTSGLFLMVTSLCSLEIENETAFRNIPPQSGRFVHSRTQWTNHVVGSMAVRGEFDYHLG